MILNFMALQTHCGSIKKRHCGRHCVCSWYVSLFFPTAFHADCVLNAAINSNLTVVCFSCLFSGAEASEG